VGEELALGGSSRTLILGLQAGPRQWEPVLAQAASWDMGMIERIEHIAATEAAADGQNGETLILDMGEPIKIESIAKKLIAASNKNIEIRFMGLRNGEKLHEILIGKDELILDSVNKNIVRISVEPLTLPIPLNSWSELFDITKL
jgi:hypothetical protein